MVDNTNPRKGQGPKAPKTFPLQRLT